MVHDSVHPCRCVSLAIVRLQADENKLKRRGLTEKLFEAYDADGSGTIELEEFQELMVQPRRTVPLIPVTPLLRPGRLPANH